jgi:polar amino acid transport system substrate-binding protein
MPLRMKLAGWVAMLSLLGCTGARADAPTLKALTEEFPPYNFTQNGKITGFSTEVVQALLREVKIQAEFQSLPWARAYEMAQNADNVLIFSVARTPQREKLFKWVGTIAPTRYFLYSLSARQLKIDHLEQAKSYQIATVNEAVGEQYLVSRGFVKGQNLQPSNKYEISYDKLKRGRVDLWIAPELVASYLARQAGDDPATTLTRSFRISDLGNDGYYLAVGMHTPDALVERLRKGLETLKSNGIYDALKNKWF